MSYLNLITKLQAFSDATVSNNPRLKNFDWLRDMSGITVDNPRSQSIQLASQASTTIFSGTTSTSIDGTTAFSVELSTLSSSRYRFTNTGGTAPAFRTSRSLALNGVAVTFAINTNATLDVGVASGNYFSAVVEGDTVFIPGTPTGDAATPINASNAGFWTVLSKVDSNNLVLERTSGDFDGYGQTVTLTSNSDIQAFSAAGVQVDDWVTISSGFAVSTQKTFQIVAVTNSWFEVISTTALAAQTGILPTAAGMIFYTQNKQFVYIEADQDCVVRTNGDTSDYQRISPIEAGVENRPGVYMKWGPTWSLTVVNKTTSVLNINVLYAD
jgi:hypothetical protein